MRSFVTTAGYPHYSKCRTTYVQLAYFCNLHTLLRIIIATESRESLYKYRSDMHCALVRRFCTKTYI